MTAPPPDIIEGTFRVVATTELAPRGSPNRRRAAARIVIWNILALAVFLALPALV
ncbi:MAG: hypothetical protein AB1942_10395 [Pseudomonadota bacterium]